MSAIVNNNITTFGQQTLIVGDCFDVLATLAPGSIDCIVTSPPYNIGAPYGLYQDDRPRWQYLSWLSLVAEQLNRVLTEDGSVFINLGSTNRDPWLVMDAANAFRAVWTLQNHIIWAKSLSIGETTYGHFKPISSKRFLNQNHESIFHFSKRGHTPIDRLAVGVPFMDKSNIKRRKHAQDRRCAGNIWAMHYPTAQSKADKWNHPAAFPLELPLRCLKLHGVRDDLVVLDPFLGTGTTLLAADALGCRGIGIDLDASYLETARLRLEAALVSTGRLSTITPRASHALSAFQT